MEILYSWNKEEDHPRPGWETTLDVGSLTQAAFRPSRWRPSNTMSPKKEIISIAVHTEPMILGVEGVSPRPTNPLQVDPSRCELKTALIGYQHLAFEEHAVSAWR